MRLDGDDSECLGLWAHILIYQRDFDGALDTFDRALQLKPDDPDLNVIMAVCLQHIGQTDEAIERIQGAMRANPHFPLWYHEAIVMAFMTAQQYEEAVRSFLAIRDPTYEMQVYAAGCLTKLGRLDEARVHMRLAPKLRPDWDARGWSSQWKNGEDKNRVREIIGLALDAQRQGF